MKPGLATSGPCLRATAGLALSLATLSWCACDNASTGPAPTDFLEGWVTNRQGAPAAGASVSLVYTIDPPLTASAASESKPGLTDLGGVLVRCEVLDYTRRLVRLLVDNPNGEAVRPPPWDGRDDAGNLVPNGLYVIRSFVRNKNDGREQFSESGHLLLQEESIDGLLEHKHALTDSEGRYRIPMDVIPIGAKIRIGLEDGRISKDAWISPVVQVYALHRVGTEIVFRRKQVVVVDRTESISVDLTLQE